MCTRESLKLRIKICKLIFSSLIFLDFIAALNSVEGMFENPRETDDGRIGTITDLNGPRGGIKDNLVETDLTNRSSEEGDRDKTIGSSAVIIYVLMEIFVICVMLVCNSSALLAVRRQQAYLLVPWLSVFLLGIFRYLLDWGLSGMSGTSGMPGMPGMPGMQGMQGMPGIPGMPGMLGMSGISSMPDMPGIPGMPGMPGMSCMPGMPGMPVV